MTKSPSPNFETRATDLLQSLSGDKKIFMRFAIRYSILLFILPLFNWGCKKVVDRSSDSLTGFWELRETSGAMNPKTDKYAAGNGNILDFTGSNYKIYKPGSVIKSGQFTIVQDATVSTSVCLVFPAGEYTSRIIYDSNYAATKIFFQVEGDRLTFISGCYAYDAGYSEVYERVSSMVN
jgi:hypothetical protein